MSPYKHSFLFVFILYTRRRNETVICSLRQIFLVLGVLVSFPIAPSAFFRVLI